MDMIDIMPAKICISKKCTERTITEINGYSKYIYFPEEKVLACIEVNAGFKGYELEKHVVLYRFGGKTTVMFDQPTYDFTVLCNSFERLSGNKYNMFRTNHKI